MDDLFQDINIRVEHTLNTATPPGIAGLVIEMRIKFYPRMASFSNNSNNNNNNNNNNKHCNPLVNTFLDFLHTNNDTGSTRVL